MKKFFKNFNLLGFLMLVVCVVLGVGDMSGAVMMAAGSAADGNGSEVSSIATGEAAQEGGDNGDGGFKFENQQYGDALSTFDYRKWAPGLIKDPVNRQIVQIRPYVNIVDTMLRYIGSDKINNLEFDYWQIKAREQRDEVVSFTATPSAEKGRCVAVMVVKKRATFRPTDNLLVPLSSVDQSSLSANEKVKDDLVLYVSKTETTPNGLKLYLTTDEDQVVPEYSGGTATGDYVIPTVKVGETVYLMGRAAGELDTTSPAIEFVPFKKHGNAQIFKTEITISNFAKMADKEVKWDLNEIEEEALFDYRRAQEKSILFSKMGIIHDPDKNKDIYRMEGLFTAIKREGVVQLDSNKTTQADKNAEITKLMKSIFIGNNGSKERFAIGGSDAVAKLSNMFSVEKYQDAVKTEVIMGITWSKIVSVFGTLNVVHHPLFDETPYGSYLLVIDPQFLKKKEVLPFERQQVDGKEHLIVNGDIVIFSETYGLAVYNPKAHAVVEVL